MSRKPFIGGNWKLNGSKKFIAEMSKVFNEAELDSEKVDVCIAPPFVYLETLRNALRKDWIVSAQNCTEKPKGAFTAEISVGMLQDIGIDWVILGHSERRHIYKESHELIGEKTKKALENGMSVIFCIGETREEREKNLTNQVLIEQLAPIKDIPDWSNIVIAYEPVWAIGTGLVATPAQAEEAHLFLRGWFSENISTDVSEKLRIIYGGSVKPQNSTELIKKPNVDGFLVGGASLQPGFVEIVKNVIENL
ncbi:triosephosphate isomerase [Anaeramoeba flamelloides]|uniref:Triosephosphate isomerase n=1 Tax=Anaeramoeba flamelloides TaxID=1746091 RepID=A0ABQ8X8S5_9EUKA|nr:triosephosphate isomerase [Anaeramoeba flamelloides]